MKHSFFKSFGYAAKGIGATFRLGFNFKVMLCIAVVAIILGFFFAISPVEWALVVLCIGIVLAGESLNTAIEATVDLLSPEYHQLAARAKDCAAGGVLFASIASLIVGILIYLPKVLSITI